MIFSLKAWMSVTFYSIMVTTTYVYVCERTYITLKVYKHEHVNPCI